MKIGRIGTLRALATAGAILASALLASPGAGASDLSSLQERAQSLGDRVSNLERDFNATLPLLMQRGASADEVRAALRSMTDQLETAGKILATIEQSRSEVF